MVLPGNPTSRTDGLVTLQDAAGAILALLNGRVPVVQTDTAGVALYAPPSGSYLFPIVMRQTAALTSGNAVWVFHNPPAATKVAHVRRIYLVQSFDGVATVQTTLTYQIIKFAGTSVDTGTSLGAAQKKRTSYAASSCVARVDPAAAITGTGIVYEPQPFRSCTLALVQNVGAFPALGSYTAPQIVHDMTFGVEYGTSGAMEFAAGEGFSIRVASVPGIVGSALGGFLEWDER